MALANGGYLHRTNIEILVNSSLKAKKKKKIGYGHLKNSGERSRAILALLFFFESWEFQPKFQGLAIQDPVRTQDYLLKS